MDIYTLTNISSYLQMFYATIYTCIVQIKMLAHFICKTGERQFKL